MTAEGDWQNREPDFLVVGKREKRASRAPLAASFAITWQKREE
jgi:hypothetical protein